MSDMSSFNVALDGPSGAGKSSVADRIAEKYNLIHMDTGAMYRAVAYALNQLQIEPAEAEVLAEALENLDLNFANGKVEWNGLDISKEIRTPEGSRLASLYSALPSIRKKMVDIQQKTAASKGYIVDGRDICDVVLPDAEVKIYLDASADARAMRRYKQDLEAGKKVEYDQVYADIKARDLRDSTREVSPLSISKQAEYVDSSDLSLDETVDLLCRLIDQKTTAGARP